MTFKQVILIRVGLICTWCKFNAALVTNVSQEPLCFISLRVRQNKPGLTRLAGDLSCALALRDALILVDRDVWTVCRDSWANKANCHVALALPGLADSNLARRRGGYQPATALYKERNMNAHATCRHTLLQQCALPRDMTVFIPLVHTLILSLLSLLSSLSGPTRMKRAHISRWMCWARLLQSREWPHPV